MMLNLPHLCQFAATSLGILIIPGPAILYIAMQSIQQGRIAGIVAVLGLELGTVFHVAAAAFGITTVSSSIVVFNLLKGIGILYLIYLAIDSLIHSVNIQPPRKRQHQSLMQIFWQGVAIEVFNPKTAFFFFAFLPQFVTLTEGNVTVQVLRLGFLFVGCAIVIDLLYAMLASSIRHSSFYNHNWWTRKQHYVKSSVYILLGIITALSSR